MQDARDVLRDCAHYPMREMLGPPFPAWLDISADTGSLADDSIRVSAVGGL